MAKRETNFVCQQCGYQSPSFLGKCPNCGAWNSLVETLTSQNGSGSPAKKSPIINDVETIKLSDIKAQEIRRTPTGIPELDRVLGGGIVPGMAVLIAGEPGIGKSTLLLELAQGLGARDQGLVLYVAGEESASQIKLRSERLTVEPSKVLVLEQTDIDTVTGVISNFQFPISKDKNKQEHFGLVIVDSIQTMTTEDLVGQAGSVGQVRECASRLIRVSKQAGLPLFLVGHVTKEGSIAGPKVLEHIVDTILTVEGERYEGLRIVRTSKNRFGPTDEVGIFEMTDKGLKAVNSTDLLTDITDPAHQGNPGACLTITMEGTRPMLVEIQALVTSSPLPSPRRVASGVDYNRMQTVIAILQKRLNVPLYKEDVYVSVSGGLKISEPAADLAMALAILSSFRNKAIPTKSLAIGELDLLGNVRRVNNLERRIKEAKTLGFKTIFSSETLRSLSEFKF